MIFGMPSNGSVTEPTNDPDLNPLMREALAWVVRLRSGDVTKADLDALRRWRALSAEHEEAFRQAARLWRGLKRTADDIVQERAEPRSMRALRPGQWTPTRRLVVGGALAASAAAYMLYRPPLQLWPSLSELQADYRTGKGERRDIRVADGVAVTMSTQTSIAVLSPEENNPRIELVVGEAAVVAHRPNGRPLAVEALGLRMIASSANFSTRCLDGVVSTTCFSGSVDVEAPLSLVQLHAGQQVTYTASDGLGRAVPADLDQAGAWQKGLLIVSNQPLSSVVNEVNRYRSGRIVITSPALANRLVNGTFHLDRLDNFPDQVQQLFGASVRTLPGGIVFLS
jgi:transmembrane sensor